jgi:hypothetical protein
MLSGGHGADIGIELAEASAPKRALRSSLATPKGLGVSDPTATDVRYGHSLGTTYLSLFQVHHLSALRSHRPLCKALRHFPNCSDL